MKEVRGMIFGQRRELLFVYSVKDANPNGDPLNANHPRYDEDTGQILVSDVRVKRTVRDQWLREGKDVFVDGEVKTLKQRVEELKIKLNLRKKNTVLLFHLFLRPDIHRWNLEKFIKRLRIQS